MGTPPTGQQGWTPRRRNLALDTWWGRLLVIVVVLLIAMGTLALVVPVLQSS